jgi:hypothetical protein
MQLVCKTCGAPLKSEHINLDNCLAKCEYCHAITYFGEMMHPSRTSADEYNQRDWLEQKDKVERHARFKVEEWGSELAVSYSWFTWGVLFLVFFCVIWDGFLVFWYGIGLSEGAPWIMFVFPLLHVAVGVGLTYFVICCFINSTTIRVAGGEIEVKHGPLPCGKTQRVTTAELEQLFCKEEISRNKNSTSYKYHVMARLTGGADKKLISGFDDATQAVYLERLIEKHLRIEDRALSGEHRW